MDENIAIRISGLSKKYSISEKKTDLSLAGRLKETFHFSNHKKVEKSNDFYALRDINLEIKKGESVGIIGRNGVGKSTLLKILAEVVEPTEGIVEINGSIASVLEVGMGFHPELTGRENVFLSGAMMGLKKRQIAKQFDEIVAFSGVEKFIDQPVKHYSSGMYVRLAFAVVANINADILLFDEVLSVGDSEFHMKILHKINELKRRGTTIVLVSHNINDIMKFCDNAILLKNGAVENLGSTGNVVSEYYHEIFDHNAQKQIFKNAQKEEKQILKAAQSAIGNSENDYFTLKSFNIFPLGKLPEEQILSSDKIVMELELEKKTDLYFIVLAFTISHYDNIFLIYTPLNQTDLIKNKGHYKIQSILPEYFLNGSFYTVVIRISVAEKQHLDNFIFYANFNSVKTFYIHDDFPYKIKFYGPVSLRNNWVVERLI